MRPGTYRDPFCTNCKGSTAGDCGAHGSMVFTIPDPGGVLGRVMAEDSALPASARPPATVTMLPGAERPEGALSWLQEVLANGKARGVVVLVVDEDGDADPRVFGLVKNQELAWAGALFTNVAIKES